MSIQDPELTARILRVLANVEALVDRFEPLAKLTMVPPTSLAAADARTSTRLGHEPVMNAGAQLSTSLDHLITWRHLMSAGPTGLQPTYAHMTLLRGALEGAVVARWLVDSTVDPRERLARAADWLREDYMKRRRIEEIIRSRPKPPRKLASERITELDAAAKALGLRLLRIVNTTDLFRAYCSLTADKGEYVYSAVSAFAHGRPWSLFMSQMTPVGPGLPDTGGLGTITANDEYALVFTMIAVHTANMAVADLQTYCSP